MKHFFYLIVALAVAVPTDEEFQALETRVATLEERVKKLESQPQPPPASTSWFASPPTADSDRTIPAGETIVLDGEDAIVRDLTVAGTLQIAGDRSTSLSFRTLHVEPTGTIVGSIPWPHTCTLSVRNLPIVAPDSNGIVCEGKFHLRGAEKECGDNRLSVEPLAGHTTLTFAGPCTGWQAGDKLFVPGTKQLDSYKYFNLKLPVEFENVTAASVDGNVVTLSAPLAYSHKGARDHTGAILFQSPVQNLSRNVTIRSESASGVRGHVLFKGRADVDVRYVKFGGLGRKRLDDPASSAPGVHFHHCYGPEAPQANGYQFTFIGNAITCPLDPMPFMWGLAIHDSHFGLIQNNDINNWAGAGLLTWSGNETQNVIEGNRVMRIGGTGVRIDEKATAGSGYWFRGPDNFVRDNVAANCFTDRTAGSTNPYVYGFNAAMAINSPSSLSAVVIPEFQGADPAVNGVAVDMNRQRGLREFSGNEVVACYNGLTFWWVGTHGQDPGDVPSEIRDLKIWHTYNWGVFTYECNRLTMDNFRFINSEPVKLKTAINFADYMIRQFKLKNSYIMRGSVGLPLHTDRRGTSADPTAGHVHFEDNVLAFCGVSGGPPSSVNGSADLCKRIVHWTRNQHPGSTKTISLSDVNGGGFGTPNLTLDNRVIVTDYNGTAEDFLVQPAYLPPLANPLPDRAEITGKLFEVQ